ncbi:MAG: LamG domain-containing protein [bacterium]|nr:LamG domain-containing protein [bacterium]
MKRFTKQFIFILVAGVIITAGGLIIKAGVGNIKVNPILGHDLDLNALYYGQAANNTVHDITTQDISVSAWVKVDVDAGATQFIVSKATGTGGQGGYILYLTSNKIRLFATDNADVYTITGNTAINDNKWHYVSAVIDRSDATQCKIYLDGVEDGATVKSGTLASIDSITSTQTFKMGVAGVILDGQIRDVKLYYAAGDHWSDSQVLYQAQHPFDYTANAGTLTDYWRLDEGSGTTLYGKVNNLTLSNVLAWTTQPKIKMVNQENATTTGNNPVGWWKMDEGTASTTYDSSGNGNTGTLTGGVQWATGKLGKGLSFDGVNDYVSVGTSTTLRPTKITVSFWGYRYSQAYAPLAISAGALGGSGGGGYHISYLNTFYIYKAVGASGLCTAPVGVDYLNQWVHIVGTYDGVNVRIYQNGVEIGTGTSCVGSITYNLPAGTTIAIGSMGYLMPSQVFKGSIDDVRIYNRALSAGEVGQMYNSTKDGYLGKIKMSTGLVGYWKLDEASWNGTTNEVIDYSGKLNHGTSVSGANTTSTAKIGRAGSFNGTNDYVSVADSVSISPTSAITISMWAKLVSKLQAGGASLIAKNPTADSTNYDYMLYIGSDGSSMSFYFKNSAGSADNLPITMTVFDSSWHLYTATFDGDIMKLYVDGVATSSKDTTLTNIRDSAGLLTFGKGYSTNRVRGVIDDLKIWNYARSGEDIKNDYAKGLARLQ